jgi:primosomal protein N' (replication factor Y) (superfamily II helicase)
MARAPGGSRGSSPRARTAPRAPEAAGQLPVAQVAVDVPLPHLDRPFDYLVPEKLDADAVPGCRVRVRFAGRLADGYLLQRAAESEHQGGLAFLERVLSPEPVLTAEIAGLARAVADRYGGTLADVLRLAVPPRHAATEREGTTARAAARPPGEGGQPGLQVPELGPWSRYRAGRSFLAALAGGRAPRAAWSALPGPHWPDEIAVAAAAALGAERGTLIVVPDARDLTLLDSALARRLGPGQHVCLAAGLGPAERYRRFLSLARGQVRVAAGTRSAMFAPVTRLGLVVIWDDGDDLHAEPRAPYPHAREVLALRAHRGGAAMLLGGFGRTAEVTQLVASGWAAALAADRDTVRRQAPRIAAAGDDAELARDEAARSARMPSLALRTAREALVTGPVLFQVPRRGYVLAVGCEGCGARARCARCGGPVSLPAAQLAALCGWCGAPAGTQCRRCGRAGLRALIVGAGRTAEELGRAFPAAPVRTSGGTQVIAEVGSSPAVIVATPGAEPRAEGGYAAAVLLDGWALLGRSSLRAAEEALRRWLNAAALVRPATQGGRVVIVADPALAAVQALVRWDPVTHAERELTERRELRFPPAIRVASLTGPEHAVRHVLDAARLPAGAEVLGPVPAASGGGTAAGGQQAAAPLTATDAPAPSVRMLVRVDRPDGTPLAAALRAAQALRSARKEADAVRLQLDPAELL